MTRFGGSNHITETMTHREAVTTLAALEKNSNRKVVIKVITKNENTSCTLKPLKKLKECNCKYIV